MKVSKDSYTEAIGAQQVAMRESFELVHRVDELFAISATHSFDRSAHVLMTSFPWPWTQPSSMRRATLKITTIPLLCPTAADATRQTKSESLFASLLRFAVEAAS